MTVGANFTFQATSTSPATSQTYTLAAGPASQGGYSVIDATTFPVGTKVTVAEIGILAGYVVTSAVSPAGTAGGSSIVVTLGSSLTEVTFTNSVGFITSTTSLTFVGSPSLAPAPQTIALASSPSVALTAAASIGSGPAGWLTVSPAQGSTPATLTVSVAVLPTGSYSGAISIAPAGGSAVTIAVTYTVAVPQPSITLVANAEGDGPIIAPNTWVEIKGSDLSPAGDTRIWQASDFVNNQMPTQLDGVGATVNGKSAYVYYISPTQINILTTPDAISGSVQVQVTNIGAASAFYTATAQAASPSFFIFNGGPYVAATHANGSLLGPTGLYPGFTTSAAPGETVVLYANGFGQTSVPVVSGSSTQSGTLSPLPVITVGGIAATVQFAGLVVPGEFQFNVVLPTTVSSGDNALVATYNGLTTQANVSITIQP